MPTLKQITCSVAFGADNTRVKEYGHRFTDGGVEVFIAVPEVDEPFSVLVQSQGFVAPGIAAYVFIDGEYQANRNIVGLQPPDASSGAHQRDVHFTFRQKEEKLPDGSFMGREWSFAKLKKSNSINGSARSGRNVPSSVGTIEVVVLRCTSCTSRGDRRDEPIKVSTTHAKEAEPTATRKSSPNLNPREPTLDTAPEAEDELGGFFGLFDGAGDDPLYDGYYPRAGPRLPFRLNPGWRPVPDRYKHEPTQGLYSGVKYPPPGLRSPGLSSRGESQAWGRQGGTPYRDNSYTRMYQEAREQHRRPSRRADDRLSPTNDEFDRLIFLHEQLNRNNIKAQEIRRSKTLFDRTWRSASRQRMQELSTQKLEEIERELREVNTKCAADTNFIFECLADMSRPQLAFATSVLREQNIQLPSFEEVQSWQQHQQHHGQDSGNAAVDDTWQSIGQGVTQKEADEDNLKTEHQGNEIHETSNQDQQDKAWNDDTVGNQWQDSGQDNNNDNAWGGGNQDLPDEWNNNAQGDQRHSRSNSKVVHTRSGANSAATKSTIRQQHGGIWAASASGSQAKREGRWDVPEKFSKVASEAPPKHKSDVTAATEPRRIIKPYWHDWAEDTGTNISQNPGIRPHARDPYQLPAQPAPVIPKNKPKGVSHGVQMGKGAAYTHKTGRPVYLDSMQDPYAVFVFHYRSKHALEKTLGRKLGDEHEAVERKLRMEKLMRLTKDELARKLLKSGAPGNRASSGAREDGEHKNEIRPEDSVSQVVTSVKASEASKHRSWKGHSHDWTEGSAHRSRRDKQVTSRSWHNDHQKGQDPGWTNVDAPDNHWKVSSRSTKSKASSSKTPEHFPDQNLQTTQDNEEVAW